MGVTTNTVNIVSEKTENIGHWITSIYSADVRGIEIVVPDPGDGYALCLESVDIIAQTDTDVWLLNGTTVLFGPMETDTASGGQIHLKFKRPVELAASTALNIDSTAAAPVSVIVQGFTRKTS